MKPVKSLLLSMLLFSAVMFYISIMESQWFFFNMGLFMIILAIPVFLKMIKGENFENDIYEEMK